MTYLSHFTVFKREAVEFLCSSGDNAATDGIFADLTFGGGGHSLALLSRFLTGKVIAFDQDPEAYSNALAVIREQGLAERLFIEKANFVKADDIVKEKYDTIVGDNGGIDGIIMDLGVSSHHFGKHGRGFSFRSDSKLDMRMDTENESIMTAEDIVNDSQQNELERIIKDYGEERLYKRIVANIVDARKEERITTTKQLEEIIFRSYPKKMRYGRIHPATRTFQAIRIAVNNELEVLSESIPRVYNLLKHCGRLVVISFHSLEDRIVKNTFKALQNNMGGKILTKKPIQPSEEEISENYRARSAKLRVIERG